MCKLREYGLFDAGGVDMVAIRAIVSVFDIFIAVGILAFQDSQEKSVKKLLYLIVAILVASVVLIWK